MAAAVYDVDVRGKGSNLSDLAKRVTPCEVDNDGRGFYSRFMEKIFSIDRRCSNCGASGSAGIVQADQSMELYLTEMGVVGKQAVRCARCGQMDAVPSCHYLSDVPSDPRLRICSVEVRDYIHKITHLQVLHDLMELLQIAAIEDIHKRRDKHLEIANFMMQKARRVCEEWCKAEYAELRYKKFLHLCEETLIEDDYSPSYPPHASDEYKEMYQMMAGSFREHRDKVVCILRLLKESLFDNPSRPSFMHWVGIAMMHADEYMEFEQRYDHGTFMQMDTSVCLALKDRYHSLKIPMGIKKIPVVFILFELPRFYHFVDFLTRKFGKKKPNCFLSDEERSSLRRYEAEMELACPKKSSDAVSPGAHINNQGGFKKYLKCHAMESECEVGSCDSAFQATETAKSGSCYCRPPRVVTSEQFQDDLVEHLHGKKLRRGDAPPTWGDGQKVVLKIETSERGDCSLKELLERLSKPASISIADKHAVKTKQKREKQSTGDSQGSVKKVEEKKSHPAKGKGEAVAEKKKSEGTNRVSSKKTTLLSDKIKSSPPPSAKKSSSSTTTMTKNLKKVPASTQTQTDPPKHSSKSTSAKSSSSKSSQTSSKTAPPTTTPYFPFANLPPNFPPQLSNLLPLVSAHIPLPTAPNMKTAAVITTCPPSVDGEPSSSFTISILPSVEIGKHLIPPTAYSSYVQNPLGPPPTPPPSVTASIKKKSKKESVSVKKENTQASSTSSSKSESKSSAPSNTSHSSPSKNNTEKGSTCSQKTVPSTPSTNSAIPPKVTVSWGKTSDGEDESSDSTSDEDHPKPMNARRLTRILKTKTDNQHFRFSQKGTPISDCNPESSEDLITQLTKCHVLARPGLEAEDFDDLPGQIFDRKLDTQISVEIPVMGPQGEFVVTPMIFAYDNKGGTIPIMPVVVNSKKPEDTVTSLEVVGRLFGLPLGRDVTKKQKEVFQQYLEIAMAASRNPLLFLNLGTAAIKSVRTQDVCSVVRLNLTDLLQEAADEDYRCTLRHLRKNSVTAESKPGQSSDSVDTAARDEKKHTELDVHEAESTKNPPASSKTKVTSSSEQKKTSLLASGDPASEETLEGGKKKRRRRRKKRAEDGEAEEGSIAPDIKETSKIAEKENGPLDECSSDAPSKKKTMARDRFRNCENCQTDIKDRIRVCSGCKKVAYCNATCQRTHWKTHKKVCSYALQKSELTG